MSSDVPIPPNSFTEGHLDAIESSLRGLVPELAQAMNPPLLAWHAADAIAYLRDAYAHSVTSEQSCIEELQTLRRERVPRTPTAAMLRIGTRAVLSGRQSDQTPDEWIAMLWRSMYDAAPREKP